MMVSNCTSPAIAGFFKVGIKLVVPHNVQFDPPVNREYNTVLIP